MSRCRHEFEEAACVLCRETPRQRRTRRTAEAASARAWVVARYPGRCGSCGDPIEPGDLVTRAGASWACCLPAS